MADVPEYDEMDAVGLAALVREGHVTPLELVDCAIARIEARNPAVNAVVHTIFDHARTTAAAVLPPGPLAGVPFLLKDLNIQYAGQRTSNGSRLWRDHVATHDSTVMARYRAAGLIVLGFTNTAELGLACETAPAAYGATRNPWDASRSAGGSSGGAAAAVAAGMVPAAHATDGGGSIRIPAAHCGLFGLKPTRARNPFGPDLGEGWNGLSVHHAITRTVRDSAALLDAAHGSAPGDPYAAPAYAGRFADAILRQPHRLRIAAQAVRHDGTDIHPHCVQAVERAAVLLAELGHGVTWVRPPIDADAMKRATRTIVAANVHIALRLRGERLGRAVTPDDVEPITWLWSEEGRHTSAPDLVQASVVIQRLARTLGTFFESYDILLTPSFGSPPLPLGTVDMGGDDLDAFYDALRTHSCFTSLYNCAGVPAASVPLAWSPDGLPVGVQIAAALGADALVLQLAGQMEAAAPRAPRVHQSPHRQPSRADA